jgi:hypothetical protein
MRLSKDGDVVSIRQDTDIRSVVLEAVSVVRKHLANVLKPRLEPKKELQRGESAALADPALNAE